MTKLQNQADDTDDNNHDGIIDMKEYKYSIVVMTMMILTIKLMIRIIIQTVMQLYAMTT